jgi:hypothetical protein
MGFNLALRAAALSATSVDRYGLFLKYLMMPSDWRNKTNPLDRLK